MARLSPEAVAAEAAFTFTAADIERLLGTAAVIKLKAGQWVPVGDEAVTFAKSQLVHDENGPALINAICKAHLVGGLYEVVGYMLQREPTINPTKIVAVVLLAADLVNTFNIPSLKRE